MAVLVTGGAGYIGSHTIVELLDSDQEVVVVDNLVNSSAESINRVERITGKTVEFHNFDLRDKQKLAAVFKSSPIDSVIHFAGLKSVGESIIHPLDYYSTNLDSTMTLLDVMNDMAVKKIVFSSSATVYGTPEELPLRETSRTGEGITNPYGQTKFILEQILTDVCISNPDMDVTLLRYFNPVGAHDSGLIGEDPNGTPNNLLPYISQVAVGKLPEVSVFGDDYDTPDGTGVRDYIHVVDLARGHLAALAQAKPGVSIYNLCTGTGTSVLELIYAFSLACGKDIPYKIRPRRPGDIASCYANAEKAARELNWAAEKSINQACEDTWRWQSMNPGGFKK